MTDAPLRFTGIQLYVEAPPPSSVALSPLQICVFGDEAVTVGGVSTVTETVFVFTHPLASVPVTVYVVVAEGETETVVPLSDPGIQSYVFAPTPVSEAEVPLQIEEGEPEAVTVGREFTVTDTVCVFVHPNEDVPVTVYVVFAVGETTTDEPDIDPGIQLYVAAPPLFKVAEDPVQIAGELEVAVTAGAGWKITGVKSVVPEQA